MRRRRRRRSEEGVCTLVKSLGFWGCMKGIEVQGSNTLIDLHFITNNWKPGHIGYHCSIELSVPKKLRPHILWCIERQPISTFILQKTLFSERHQFKIFEVFNVEFFRKTLGQKSSLTPSRWKLRPRNIFFFSPTKPEPINHTKIILLAIKK